VYVAQDERGRDGMGWVGAGHAGAARPRGDGRWEMLAAEGQSVLHGIAVALRWTACDGGWWWARRVVVQLASWLLLVAVASWLSSHTTGTSHHVTSRRVRQEKAVFFFPFLCCCELQS
jgi:hypothetical protein